MSTGELHELVYAPHTHFMVISLGHEVASGCVSTRGDTIERLHHPDGRLSVWIRA